MYIKKIKQILLTAIIIGLCSACATQRFYMTKHPTKGAPDSDKLQSFFIGGIGQTQETNANRICKGSKVSHVEATLSFLDFLLAAITSGLYAPRTAKVYCT